MPQETMIRDALAGAVSVGEQVTLKGWVRTRRDSKAGFSFVNWHAGSCFDAIQVVVPNELENYEEEILKLTSGASIIVTGELVESPGKGQAYDDVDCPGVHAPVEEGQHQRAPGRIDAAGLAAWRRGEVLDRLRDPEEDEAEPEPDEAPGDDAEEELGPNQPRTKHGSHTRHSCIV